MDAINGTVIAEAIIQELLSQPAPKRWLGVVTVDPDEATRSFLRKKQAVAQQLGVDMRLYEYDASITNDGLRKAVHTIADKSRCGGVIVQLPLPEHINPLYSTNSIPARKDVDVLGQSARGAFYNGRSVVVPPAVSVVKTLLKHQQIDGGAIQTMAVVGQGYLVGRPISAYYAGKVPSLIAIDKGADINKAVRDADVVVLGTGQAGLVTESMVRDGAGVIDFGYGKNNQGKMRGDFSIDDNNAHSGWYTPTPGGTGPILVAHIFSNFYALNKEQQQ